MWDAITNEAEDDLNPSLSIEYYGRYRAPMTTPTVKRCRRVSIPDDPEFVRALNEAVALLTSADVWQESEGSLTAQQCAILMAEMWNGYRQDVDCEVGSMIVGSIVAVATEFIPAQMLVCDGSLRFTSEYPELAAAISRGLWETTEIVNGEASPVTFRVPDLRDRFVMGVNVDNNDPLEVGGEAQVTLTVNQMPTHTHIADAHTHTQAAHQHSFTGNANSGTTPTGTGQTRLAGAASLTSIATPIINSATVTLQNTGGGQAHNNLPPFMRLFYCIVAKPQ